jgi:hypothetical protein
VLAAVRYRIRDPLGMVVDERAVGWAADGVAGLTVPAVPGVYAAEVWLEDSAGAQGPATSARLRFDDTRPASIEPLPVTGWIGRAAFPVTVRLGHPTGPAPISGIRGYAVSIDGAAGGAPCAKDYCEVGEISLPGGAADDSFAIGALPEGTSYLHAVAVSGSGMKSAAGGQTRLRVDTTDPVTELSGVPEGWASHPVSLTAIAVDTGSGMGADGPGAPFTAIRVDGRAPVSSPGASTGLTLIEDGVHEVAYYARDAAGNANDGGDVNGLPSRAPRTKLVRIDREAPSAAFPNSQDPRDPDLIRVRITDRLSGPDSSRGWIGVRRAGSGDRFEPLPPAASGAGELRARWDSDSYPKGEYEFRALVYDGAGNTIATTRRGNGEAMVLASPLKAATSLHASFGATSPGDGTASQRVLPCGRGEMLSGRLTIGRAGAQVGLPVRITERFARGAGLASRTSTVRTRPDGTFSIHLAPGPSRTVAASFEGSPTLTRSASRTLGLRVRSGVRLSASSAVARVGGAPLRFRGGVTASPGTIPADGLSIQLQFRLPGLPWAEFRTVQTDARGRFRYAYRFSDDDSRGARFLFRAYAPAQGDWPYEPGGSKPVAVRGI